jgi:hypothetical protein
MKRSYFTISILAAVFTFSTVLYVSCTKSSNSVSCTGNTCSNGGYCTLDTNTHLPVCTCPVGYEGATCTTLSVSKFIGNWNLRQTVMSDSTAYNKDTTQYTVDLVKANTPTTFFINNFFDNQYYNYIICTLDSTNSSNFIIDTISAYHMVTSNFIIRGGYGFINSDTIKALVYIQFKNQTSNWQIDTVNFTMVPQ